MTLGGGIKFPGGNRGGIQPRKPCRPDRVPHDAAGKTGASRKTPTMPRVVDENRAVSVEFPNPDRTTFDDAPVLARTARQFGLFELLPVQFAIPGNPEWISKMYGYGHVIRHRNRTGSTRRALSLKL